MREDAEKDALSAFEERLAALAAKVREGLAERARELRQAATALASDEASAREDVRRFAHKIRGTAGSHGIAGLTEIAGRVEELALRAAAEELTREVHALADALERESTQRASAREATPEPIVHAPPKAPLEGLRVLAVDDDASTRKLLTLTLVNVGRAEVAIEERGAILLERLRAERFDVVIVDAMMPEMNGLACLTSIASDGLHREGVRYFVLSAATAVELGWSLPPELEVGWLRKPFRPRELVDAVASTLGR